MSHAVPVATRRLRPGGLRKAAAQGFARRPRLELSGSRLSAVVTLGLVGAISLWMLLQVLFLGALAADRAQSQLYAEFRAQLAEATAPLGPAIEPGEPVALIRIPKLGVQEVIVEGTASGDMLFAPGHRRDTVLPGQVGTSAIYGRSMTNGAPFAAIATMIEGDTLEVTTAQGTQVFTVIGVRRAGDPLPLPPTGTEARLTLVTSQGSGEYASLAPNEVIYVDAETDKGFPAPPGLPQGLPESERAMAGEATAMPVLVLSLAGLIAVACGVAYAVRRFEPGLVWLIATPLTVSMVWVTTDVLMRLMPNLM